MKKLMFLLSFVAMFTLSTFQSQAILPYGLIAKVAVLMLDAPSISGPTYIEVGSDVEWTWYSSGATGYTLNSDDIWGSSEGTSGSPTDTWWVDGVYPNGSSPRLFGWASYCCPIDQSDMGQQAVSFYMPTPNTPSYKTLSPPYYQYMTVEFETDEVYQADAYDWTVTTTPSGRSWAIIDNDGEVCAIQLKSAATQYHIKVKAKNQYADDSSWSSAYSVGTY
jgi:hypothetical protein